MRIDEFSSPLYIDGEIDATERTRFSSFGFDIIVSSQSTLGLRIDEFSSPSDIDGVFTTEEKTRFLTFGFNRTILPEGVIGWSERVRIRSYISLQKDLGSEISLEYLLGSYIVDEEEENG